MMAVLPCNTPAEVSESSASSSDLVARVDVVDSIPISYSIVENSNVSSDVSRAAWQDKLTEVFGTGVLEDENKELSTSASSSSSTPEIRSFDFVGDSPVDDNLAFNLLSATSGGSGGSGGGVVTAYLSGGADYSMKAVRLRLVFTV